MVYRIIKKYWVYLLLTILLYFPLFLFLDYFTIRVWDEARIAINAVSMYENKNYLVTYFFNEPEMWNLKPPLLIWLQNICFYFTGINELGIRLPCAIAAFLTCFILFIFLRFPRGNYLPGFLSAMILVSIRGYVAEHGTRSGDYDALLTLFTTSYCFTFFLYCSTGKTKYIFLSCVLITMACMTKSVAGLTLIPGLFLFAIISGKLKDIFKTKALYFGVLFFVSIITAYYLLRNHYNPGYLNAVLNDDLFMLSSSTTDHNETWNFYFRELIYGHRFNFWIWFLPLGIFSLYFQKDPVIRRINLYAIIISVTFLLVISIPKYKCSWYVLPAYPWLAMITGIGIYTFLELLIYRIRIVQWKQHVFLLGIILLLFYPYRAVLLSVTHRQDDLSPGSSYHLSYYLRDNLNNAGMLNDYVFLFGGYDCHTYFYLHMLNRTGSNVSIANGYLQIADNTKIFVYDDKVKEFIKLNYEYSLDNSIQNIDFITLIKWRPKS